MWPKSEVWDYKKFDSKNFFTVSTALYIQNQKFDKDKVNVFNKEFQKRNEESKKNELDNILMAKSKIPDKIKPLATSLTKWLLRIVKLLPDKIDD